MFGYRLTFRNIPRIISSIMHDIYYGIINLFIWFPIIWKDRDWDWAYLSRIMEFKFRKMSYNTKKYDYHTNSERDARQLLICAELLKRLEEDDWKDVSPKGITPKQHLNRMNEWQQMLGREIGKHFRNWWW